MNIVACGAQHGRRLTELFGELSERDLTLIKEDLTDPDAIRRWATRPGQQWVALDGSDIVGYAAVRPLPEWSDHVGEMRLVVDPARRRAGIGRALARHALLEAVRAGRRKLVVELAADQENALAMFTSLGFTGEALLRDHIRDRSGQLHDLVMLAHFVDGMWAGMDAIGLSDELDRPEA
jgi:ribosomal protein S18 acetylase RimI-like enzyme